MTTNFISDWKEIADHRRNITKCANRASTVHVRVLQGPPALNETIGALFDELDVALKRKQLYSKERGRGVESTRITTIDRQRCYQRHNRPTQVNVYTHTHTERERDTQTHTSTHRHTQAHTHTDT